MSERFTFRNRAPENTRFTPDSFDGIVGSELPVTILDRVVPATVTAAQVTDDGHGFEITVELPDDSLPKLSVPDHAYSTTSW